MSDMGKVNDLELEPVSDKAEFTSVVTKEYGGTHRMDIIIEEDMLVPDTEPDMEQIFNVSAEEVGISFEGGQYSGTVKGELKMEVLYRSAYDGSLMLLESRLPFSKDWEESFEPEAEIRINCEVRAVEYRVINERKYRVKLRAAVTAKEIINRERKLFTGIKDMQLELLKEKASVMSLACTKTKENEINEELKINNEKIRPVRVIKSSFVVSENHRQLTSDKLVLNTTVWVRIIYMAELASHGNIANYPMYYTGKIDSTQFIPLDSGQQADACRVNCDVSELVAEINDSATGFCIKGFMKTTADVFACSQLEIVTDFYDAADDMICDNVQEPVCSSLETAVAQQIINETVDLHIENEDTEKIVYTDARITEYDIEVREGRSEIYGKMQVEALVLTDEGRSVTARKLCEFSVPVDIPADCSADCCRIFAREISADLAESFVSITVTLQVEADFSRYGSISIISNPCIVHGEKEARYPLTVCTVKEGETLWDIGKRYRVPAASIQKINGASELLPGMKIIITR